MGQIVAFRTTKQRRRAPQSGGAMILFFTGVRYERARDEDPSPLVEADLRRQRGKRKGFGGKRQRRS
jgi:hypothetical protein